MTYRLIIYDNFHYMDADESYEGGSFATADEAIAAAKKIVDEFLVGEHRPGMRAAKLYEQYTSFGDDPHVSSTDRDRVDFSAWKYAEQRCGEICGEPFSAPRKPR